MGDSIQFRCDRRRLVAGAVAFAAIAPLYHLVRFPEVSISMALLNGTDAELLAIARCTGAPVL